MGGRIAASSQNANYTLPDTLVCGFEVWITNSSAGNITITAPTGISGAAFTGTGATTLVMATGTKGCFLNVGGKNIHARVFTV